MLSKRVGNIQPSATMAISARAAEMAKAGIDVVSFGAGEPDFDTPQNIKEAAIKAIKQGFTKYTAAAGIPELKKVVCEKFKRDNGLDYSPKEVLISCGGKHSIYNALQALINEGDEVILPSPYWVSFPQQIALAGGRPVFVKTERLKIKARAIKEKISDKTKALILNSPSNPSGAVCELEELKSIAQLAVENNIFVISDEVYERFVYDGKSHYSIAALGKDIKELTITVNAVSKTYAMTGWRIGYCAGPAKIIIAMAALQSHSTSNPCSIAQKAALEALTGPQDSVNRMIKEFDARRKCMVERLNNIKGLSCAMPEGAFYAFPDISATGLSSMEFCPLLLEKAKVAAVPGKAFGSDSNIRLSYACSMEDIEKGMDRIGSFVAELQR